MGWLAYVALALQMLIAAPHVHSEWGAGHRSPFVAAHGSGLAARQKAPPCRHDDDRCPACLALHTGGGVVPEPPVVAAPHAVGPDRAPALAVVAAPAPATSSFLARAPPA